MISHIQFRKGFALELPYIGNKRFEFTNGINVLFGPNGCGKSTIQKTLKAYCGIKTGGWTKINDPTELGTTSSIINFPNAYCVYAPGKCLADVGWTGSPSFFNDGDIKVSETFFYQNAGQSHDGITTEHEQMMALAKKPSSGQYRIERLNKVFDVIKQVPVSNEVPTNIQRSGNTNFALKEQQYWQSLGMFGRNTIILDEPERSLSLPKQKELLCKLIPLHMKGFQVIIATHSVFALSMKDVNIIDMDPGYVKECNTILNINPTQQMELELISECLKCAEYEKKIHEFRNAISNAIKNF